MTNDNTNNNSYMVADEFIEETDESTKNNNPGVIRRLLTIMLFIAIPICVGLIASALTSDAMVAFNSMAKPPLAPPAMLFPIAWTILYVLMGLASYIIYKSNTKFEVMRFAAMFLYGTQLFFNFIWSIIFFRESNYMGAFVWLICLWGLVLLMLLSYRKISKTAFFLTIPYILWLTFAGYLNISIALMN